MEIFKCIHCLSVFTPVRSGHIFCSKKCRERQWLKDNPERSSELKKRWYYKTNIGRCKTCTAEIALEIRKKGLLYCSEDCRLIARMVGNMKRHTTLKGRVHKHKISIGCSACGYNKCGAALDWHHTDDNKERRITVKSYFTELGEQERSKCILLCANCHREVHADIKEEENGSI